MSQVFRQKYQRKRIIYGVFVSTFGGVYTPFLDPGAVQYRKLHPRDGGGHSSETSARSGRREGRSLKRKGKERCMHMNDQPPVAGNARSMGIHFMELRRVRGGGNFLLK